MTGKTSIEIVIDCSDKKAGWGKVFRFHKEVLLFSAVLRLLGVIKTSYTENIKKYLCG